MKIKKFDELLNNYNSKIKFLKQILIIKLRLIMQH